MKANRIYKYPAIVVDVYCPKQYVSQNTVYEINFVNFLNTFGVNIGRFKTFVSDVGETYLKHLILNTNHLIC